MTQPLHTKYRPQKFEDMKGNDATLQSLISVVRRSDGRQHSYLFYGPSGCGKTTLARIVKNELGCSDEEFREYNTANTRGIDTIRQIAMDCRYAPVHGKLRVFLMDECHKLTNDGQNALLKLLEDTPNHVYFMLCTTDPEKLLKTIRTRCASFPVTFLTVPQIARLIKETCQKEGVDISKELITKIAKSSQGSPRQALVLLDQVVDIVDPAQAMLALETAILGEATVIDLCRAIVANPSPVRWQNIIAILESLDTVAEPEQIRRAIKGYLWAVLRTTPENRIGKLYECFNKFIFTDRSDLGFACFEANKI